MRYLSKYSTQQVKARCEAVARRATRRILSQYSGVLAIGVDGSLGRRQPLPYSDIDVFTIKKGKKPESIHYIDNGCLVGIYFFGPRHKMNRKGIDFYWARGGAVSGRALYDPKGVLRHRLRTQKIARPTRKIVDSVLYDAYYNIIEYAGKLRNGWLLRDEYLTRYAARVIAQRSEEGIIALNDLSPISENTVWHLVMRAEKRPKHFVVDYPIALGINGTARTERVFRSGLRLAGETLRIIQNSYRREIVNKTLRNLLSENLEQLEL